MPPSTRPQANRQQNLASVITSIDLNEFNHILPTTPHDDSNSDADSDLFSPQSFEAGIFSNRNPNMPVRRTADSRARKRTATQAAADLGGDDADNEATEGAAAALEPSRKRRDTGTGRSSRRAQGKPIVIDDVDDENNDAEAGRLKETLQKQREEQVKAQLREEGAEPPRLNRSQCVICMDSFTDMTATSCGHIFCHECLISALKASEARRAQATGTHGKKSQCPVCRTSLNRKKSADIIPLLLMKKGAATQPRRAKAKNG